MKVGIINVTGYAGIELARILLRHGDVEIVSVTGRGDAGKHIGEVFPHLSSLNLRIEPEITGSVDVVFSALPHKASAETCGPLLKDGIKVIDISADFRLTNVEEFEEWYNVQHPYPEYVSEAVYGLTELHRDEVRVSSLIANPGCYPTSAILALAPAVKAGILEPGFIIDSKSGISGAGRGMNMTTHFSEVNESVTAYSLGGHRHLPEITQELRRFSDDGICKVTFLPHLIPMTRGILSSCYAHLKPGVLSGNGGRTEALNEIYQEFYRGEPFIKLAKSPPSTKQTMGNNDCILYPAIDERTDTLMVISCLDNLVKGAAGQAIQNLNVMYGLPETQGLEALALYP
jgi:N-acetyl-gamma-glutamyl-phosphate reductase